MKTYYIIGSGGFAKEVMFLASRSLGQKDFCFGGFIDLNPNSSLIQIGNESYSVFNEIQFIQNVSPKGDVVLFLGLADTSIIERVVTVFRAYTFPNLIHPSVEMHAPSIKLGKGNILTAGSILTVDIEIGDFNVLNLNTTVGHDSRIGNYNILNPGVNVSGSVQIGNSNLIGTNATILQGVKIGSMNKLGASCMVNRDIHNNQIVVGVPAKPIEKR